MTSKKKVVLIGGGGHAKVVEDILSEWPERYDLIGFVAPEKRSSLDKLSYLGGDECLQEIYASGVNWAFVAVGDNLTRKKLVEEVKLKKFSLVNAISKFSKVSSSVTLGSGVAIMPGAVINASSRIGDGAIINSGSTVDHDCHIGSNVHLAPGCTLAGNVQVDVGTFLGVGCKVINNIKIGRWSIVGAGAVVIRDIPPNTLSVGVPSRVVKILEMAAEEGELNH